ncbi:MAG: hypothetical protein OJF49_001785 [Ktedonobacterales bacterium]|jgi:hypothetical protein|nr:MAG: hypothetical protein OJF49_001785 [Ktedonobacterales bacterium]
MSKYSVYRRIGDQHKLAASFKTLAEATTHADKLRQQPAKGTHCFYYVTGPGLPTPAGLETKPARGITDWFTRPAQPRPPAKRTRKKPDRPRHKHHDWETEYRDTNITRTHRTHRTEDELGIGIPAQYGKGRRSRRGWYIP